MVLKTLICMLLLPFALAAQTAHKYKSNRHPIKTAAIPPWAEAHQYNAQSHVYFPDYYTFYDPERGGYVFWENGTWSFTPTMPVYLSNKDLAKSRVQILKNISLDLHPENDYPRYMKLYPPIPTDNNYDVPVPRAQGMAGAQ